MNKRKLPKAIRRTTDDLRPSPAEPAGDMEREAPTTVAVAPVPGLEGEVLAPAPSFSAPAQTEQPSATQALVPLELNPVRRRTRALSIVERHATYSAAGGIIPLPIVNVASVTAIIVRMVKRLATLYGVPFERDRARAIIVALAGGATPTGLGAVTASTLYYFVPGSAFIGLAVSSVAAVACTRSIGRIFVEHFESGATLHDFSLPQGK
jgi:uncharacterized protein (DUF697 family)